MNSKNQNFKTPEKNSETNKTQVKNKTITKNTSTIILFTEAIKNLFKYITDVISPELSQEKKEKIASYFHKLFSKLNKLSSEKKNLISKYDSILRLSEEKIRSLYSTLFNMKIKITFLENNIDILLRKEKEYRLVKEKTGVLVENGVVIHNDRKENEIFILRAENSNLKNVIKEKEKKIEELKSLNDKYINDNNSCEKINEELKRKIDLLKYKIKAKYNKKKGHSYSSIDLKNLNINDASNNSKCNITVNNSLNKGNNNKIFINGIINNNHRSNNNIYQNKNMNNNINNMKRKYNSNLLNYNYLSLIHCQSMGNLNLNILNNTKSKTKSKSKSIKNNNISKNNSKNQNAILNNINVSPIHNKKKLCFTPHNNEIVNKINFQPIKKSKSKNNSKSKNKKNNSYNGIKVIYNSKTKINKISEKEIIQKKLMKDLTWNQNGTLNNSGIPKSTTKLKKRMINKRSNSKQYYNENEKNKKNNLLIMNISGKENIPVNKTYLSSIKKKNTINTSNNSFYSKNNFNL